MLATDISATNCLGGWVSNVSSTGTFVKNPAMTSLPNGINGIPNGWTVVDDGDTIYSIIYNSSDGNIVTPNNINVFGANIVSNNYINGQGIITFDRPVTYIGQSAFSHCSSLTSITIPNSVTSIGRNAFWYCDNLRSVNIGDNVKTIGQQAFNYCTSLRSITFPDSITSIGDYAFENCTNLTVYCKATTPPSLGSLVFNNTSIYVPTSSVDTYKTAYGWRTYADVIDGYDF